ncbi:MAG: hypothetical protein U9Q19_02675 [Pseudomonadota bacterium]|nr:hypothetical protein [Pseudomonadota bacterium]
MAIYTTDFSEYTSGVAPSDWTDRWDTDWTLTVEDNTADSIGAKVFKVNPGTTNVRRLVSWDDLDSDANRDDSELLVRVRAGATTNYNNMFSLMLRGSGAAGSENGYTLWMDGNDLELRKYVAGANSNLSTITSFVHAFKSSSTWDYSYFWLRFRANGTSLKAKAWSENQNEPDTWLIDETDSSISAAGWCGLCNFDAIGTQYVNADYFSIGTNGDSPTVPISVTSETQLNQIILEVARAYTPPAGGTVAPIICINT